METIVVNALVGFSLVLFGAMAIFPMLIEGKGDHQAPLEDDQIISIQPVPTLPVAPRALAPRPAATPAPDRREAA
jgi:hypothetical protein